jgi:hypothetical protein
MTEPVTKETRLRDELAKRAFHKGDGPFAQIEYCDFCSYSREWIAEHGHGPGCLLQVLP